MAKIKPSTVRILENKGRLVTLLFVEIDRQVEVSKFLFDIQCKLGRYRVLEE